MIILDQNKSSIHNLEHIVKVYIGSDFKSIKCAYVGGSGSGAELGKYQSAEDTSFVVEMIAYAIKNNELMFQMPPTIFDKRDYKRR